MQINLTDAEQRFADSPAGRVAIARQRMTFDMSEAYKGSNARPWTDAMEAQAARDLATRHARNAVETAAFMADAERRAPVARAAADTARAMMSADLSNAWRNPR